MPGGDHRLEMRFVKLTSLLLIFAMGILGCSASPDLTSGIHTTDDLFAALKSAGINPSRSGAIQRRGFGTEGVILEWGNSEIEVFEFQNEEKYNLISIKLGSGSDDELLDSPGEETIWASGRIIVLYAGVDGGIILLLNGLLGDPLRYEAPEIDEPFPPAVVAAIRSLADLEQMEPGLIRLEGYEQVDWPNACLGLPSPEELCAQVITPGWRVELVAGEKSYVLHTDAEGSQIRYSSGSD